MDPHERGTGRRPGDRRTYWAVVAALAVMVLAMAAGIYADGRDDAGPPPAPGELRTRLP